MEEIDLTVKDNMYVGKTCAKCGNNVRYKSTNRCVYCRKTSNRRCYRTDRRQKIVKEYRSREDVVERKKEYMLVWREENREHIERYKEENKERIRETARKYSRENRDKLNEKNKRYRKCNPEQFKKYTRKYYQNNGEEIKKRKRDYDRTPEAKEKRRFYLEENKERIRKVNRKWRQDNKEKVKAKAHRYLAKKRKNGGSFTGKEWNEMCDYYDDTCLCCKEKFNRDDLHFDHVISVHNGGSSFINNAQPLCETCNKSKGSKNTDYREIGDRYRGQQNIE